MRFEFLEPRLALALGDLDLSFSNDGYTTVPVGIAADSSDELLDVAVQSDDAIVSLAQTYVGDLSVTSLIRTRADGTLDPTFGGGDQVLEAFGQFWRSGGVGIQSNQRIVAAVDSRARSIVVARYLPDGQRDASFGDDGLVSLPFAVSVVVDDVLVDREDNLLVAGIMAVGSENGRSVFDSFVLRFNSEGVLDQHFGTGGMVLIPTDGFSEEQTTLVAGPSDSLILVGNGVDANSVSSGFVVKLASDGQPDKAFAASGRFAFVQGPDSVLPWQQVSAVVDASGGLTVGTTVGSTASSRFIELRKLDSNGQLDPAFGDAGVARTTVPSYSDAVLLHITSADDGSILALGSPNTAAGSPILWKYQTSGQLDTSWGTGGVAFINSSGEPVTLARQSAGQIIVAQKAISALSGGWDVGLLALDPSGQLRNEFGENGVFRQTVVSGVTVGTARSLKVLGDGDVYAAGPCRSDDLRSACVVRLNAAGQVDTDFGDHGQLRAGPSDVSSTQVVVSPSGRTTVLSVLDKFDGQTTRRFLHVERYDASGRSLDGATGGHDVDLRIEPYALVQALPQADDSTLLALWTFGPSGNTGVALVRLTPAGLLDSSFGESGLVRMDDNGEPLTPNGLMLQDGERIVAVAVNPGVTSPAALVLRRYLPNGTLDESWGDTGVTRIVTGTSYSACSGATVLANGDLLLTCSIGAIQEWFIRLDSNGRLVSEFGDNGIIVIPNPEGVAEYFVLQTVALPNGGWAIAGTVRDADELAASRAFVQFYADDGQALSDWGEQGTTWIDTPAVQDAIFAMALEPDGDLVVAGVSRDFDSSRFLVARLVGPHDDYRPWLNASSPKNVDGDSQGLIAPNDVLPVINDLNLHGARRLEYPAANTRVHAWLDVDGDGYLSALDALIVLNHVNAGNGEGGEWSDASIVNAAFAYSAQTEVSVTSRRRVRLVTASH